MILLVTLHIEHIGYYSFLAAYFFVAVRIAFTASMRLNTEQDKIHGKERWQL